MIVNRTVPLVLAFLLIAAFSGVAHSADAPAAAESAIHEEVLDNGLRVLILRDPHASLAVFQVWYNAGSIHEQVGKTGLSHLLEHMMFKGTPTYGPKTFSRIIKRAGGIDNAGTSKDYVFYFQKLAPDRLHLSIDLEADRMQNLIMDPEETLAERDVVMEERRLRYEDDPQSLVYEAVLATAFKNHPYRWPVIGWMSDLRNITRDDLWAYYRQHYVPNNALIIVVGNVDVDSLMQKIREKFGTIPRGPDVPANTIGEPEQRGEKRIFVKKEAELPYVLSAYKVPNILHKDAYALEVLAAVLSGGKSARIYKSLIDEKRVALSAGADYSGIFKYPYLFHLYGTALPGKSIQEVEDALYEEVERIKKELPDEKEVQKAKNQILADFIMDQDSVFYRAMVLARFQLIRDWRLKDEYMQGIADVTAEDVSRVARKYLVEEKRTVGILIPEKRS